MTGFGDAARNFINGPIQGPLTVGGFLDADADHRRAVIKGAYQNGSQLTLPAQAGINAAPLSGDPEHDGKSIARNLQTGDCDRRRGDVPGGLATSEQTSETVGKP